MIRWASIALPLVLTGCLFSGGGPGEPAPVQEPDVLEFADHIQGFYRSLEGISLDTLVTFEDGRLRGFFGQESDFVDYYAALATAVRAATFRNSRARRVDIIEFRFDHPNLAQVEVVMRGDHERGLLFWDVELLRTDVWRRVEGGWVLDPEKL